MPCLKMTSKQLLFLKGQRRLVRSFNITSILKTLQKVDLLEHIILAKYQKSFLPFSKQNILDPSLQISGSESDEQPPANDK